MRACQIALFGVGPMAAQHARAIRAVPGLDLAVSVSRDPAKAKVFAAEHAIAASRGLEDFLSAPEADGLYVVAPADVMRDLAIRLSRLGLPLMLEKPVGLSLEETRAARDAIQVPHMVGLNRRFYEIMQRGKALIEQRGGVTGIEIHMPEYIKPLETRYGRHVLESWMFGNSVHLVDLFRYFAGEPAEIDAARRQRSWHDISVVASLTFASNALGVFHAHWGTPGGWRVSVCAEDVQIVFQPVERALVWERGRQPAEWLPEGPDKELKAGLYGQAEAFGQLIRTGQIAAPAADLSDYLRSVELVSRIFFPSDNRSIQGERA